MLRKESSAQGACSAVAACAQRHPQHSQSAKCPFTLSEEGDLLRSSGILSTGRAKPKEIRFFSRPDPLTDLQDEDLIDVEGSQGLCGLMAKALQEMTEQIRRELLRRRFHKGMLASDGNNYWASCTNWSSMATVMS